MGLVCFSTVWRSWEQSTAKVAFTTTAPASHNSCFVQKTHTKSPSSELARSNKNIQIYGKATSKQHRLQNSRLLKACNPKCDWNARTICWMSFFISYSLWFRTDMLKCFWVCCWMPWNSESILLRYHTHTHIRRPSKHMIQSILSGEIQIKDFVFSSAAPSTFIFLL